MTEMEGTGMVPPKLQHTQQMWPAGVVSWWRDPTDSTMLWVAGLLVDYGTGGEIFHLRKTRLWWLGIQDGMLTAYAGPW